MSTAAMETAGLRAVCDGLAVRQAGADAALVRRVNQLYHDLTQDVFDAEHCHRHRVERGFWRYVAEQCLGPSPVGRTLVDLACGTGFEAGILVGAMRPGDRLIGIDISPSALASTAQKCRSRRLVLAAGDGSALPLGDGSVDLFAINAALHHMPDDRAVLAEVHRVLRPGGWFALGYEPNLRHFRSAMLGVSRTVDRLAWYASPRQNLRRLRCAFGQRVSAAADTNDARVARTINQRLLSERALAAPLDVNAILDAVDPHARGAREHAGFDPVAMIQSAFADYEVVRLVCSDYFGEAVRRLPAVRGIADAALRLCRPAHGSLFSCLLRKPSRAGGR